MLADLVGQARAGTRSIMGFMLESNLRAGNQALAADRSALAYGVSITDACIDWAATERCVNEAAERLPPE